MSVGNRVFLRKPKPDPELIEQFANIATSNIADVMGRSSAMHPRIRLLSNPSAGVFAGPALTVKGRAGDNLMLHKALNIAEEGDVIVVANEGEDGRALLGEIILSYACEHKKLGGIVLDGPVRDVDTVSSRDFFLYGTGSTPGGPYKEGPGEVNVPVSCGGISVSPGDIIVGDRDGIIVIPLKDAGEVLEKAKGLQALDAEKVAASKTGAVDRSWVEEKLAATGCEIIDDFYSRNL